MAAEDFVVHHSGVDGPDRLWVRDVRGHATLEGTVYLATVLDAWSRRIIGSSIAEHMRSELVVDALQMAVWGRRPEDGKTICHSDHGARYTSWAFGRRLRAAGILGSMGTIGDRFDNSMAESFFGTPQLESLDRRRWETRKELADAVFDYIEGFYNPKRRHASIGYLSPIEFEFPKRDRRGSRRMRTSHLTRPWNGGNLKGTSPSGTGRSDGSND